MISLHKSTNERRAKYAAFEYLDPSRSIERRRSVVLERKVLLEWLLDLIILTAQMHHSRENLRDQVRKLAMLFWSELERRFKQKMHEYR